MPVQNFFIIIIIITHCKIIKAHLTSFYIINELGELHRSVKNFYKIIYNTTKIKYYKLNKFYVYMDGKSPSSFFISMQFTRQKERERERQDNGNLSHSKSVQMNFCRLFSCSIPFFFTFLLARDCENVDRIQWFQ